MYVGASDRSGTRNPGFRKFPKEMGLRQIEQGFSSFFAKFLALLMIFQSFAVPLDRSTLKNYQICQNYAKN